MVALRNLDVSNHLLEDERILWQEKAPRGFYLRPGTDAFITPPLLFAVFGAIFLAIAASFASGSNPLSVGPVLIGAAFVIIGLYASIGQVLRETRRRWSTTYILTNRRALIIAPRKSTVRTFLLSASAEITTREREDGRGSITFGTRVPTFSPLGYYGSLGFDDLSFEFERLPNVREVLSLIARIQSGKA